jgi:hypothetical protein
MEKKKKNRKVIRAMFNDIEQLTSEDIQASDILRDLLKMEAPHAIEEAIANKKVYATIFEINTSNSYIEIHRRYWIDTLDTCLRWYLEEKSENYEMCGSIAKLVEKIKSSQRTAKN